MTMKILVVDDKPDNVDLLQQILEDQHQVISASDGAGCIELARAEQPDLIILDVQMPQMDGYEVLQRLKGDTRTRKIPVIFLSAEYKDTDRVVAGLELGAFDYITKPVAEEILLAKVGVVARIKQAEDEQRESSEHLAHQIKELERLNKLFVDREFKVRELQQRVRELESRRSERS